LYLRKCNIDDKALDIILEKCTSLTVKVNLLDLYNNNITGEGMLRLSEHVKERKNFESLGLGKNKLKKLSCLLPFFEQCGRVKISSDD